MARKTTKRKPRARGSATPDSPKIPPAVEPTKLDQATGAEPTPKRKPGRPSNAQKQAEQEVAAAASALDPTLLIPATAGFLNLVAIVVKGDAPTKQEIVAVNAPLTAVVNKYSMDFKYAEEIILVLAIGTTSMSMRSRAQAKRGDDGDKTIRDGDRRNEGFREVGDSEIVPGSAAAKPSH